MPKILTKTPVDKKKVIPKPKEQSEILYPTIEFRLHASGVKGATHPPIQAAYAMKILGWETENDYTKRMMALDPTKKEEECKYGDDYTLVDLFGNKVKCSNNLNNRPLTEPWMCKIAQEILTHNYVLNLENIVISMYGNVTSGQHRLLGLIRAYQIWLKDKTDASGEMYSQSWRDEPYIETCLILGGSEDPKVLRTIDNVNPRTLTDVFYTSTYFKHLKNTEKKECCRMLDVAVDFLWKRTHAGNAYQKFQTHSASVDFVDRHKKLLESIKILFDANSQRSISELRVSNGLCAGLHFLMATSNSNNDVYKEDLPPTEKSLDFTQWDLATEFWKEFASKTTKLEPVREAMRQLINEELHGEKSRAAVFTKAWNEYAFNGALTAENLSITEFYTTNENGERKMIDCPKIGGIDQGYKFGPDESKDPPPPTPEELEAQAKVLREQRAKELREKAEAIRAEKAKKNSVPSVQLPAKTVLKGK